MLAALERGLTSGADLCSSAFAAALDGADGEVCLRAEFHVPRGAAGARYRRPDDDAVYLCGHSLGLAPVRAAGAVAAEMNLWAARGVEGHFERGSAPGSGAWASAEDAVASLLRAGAAVCSGSARMRSLEHTVLAFLDGRRCLAWPRWWAPTPTKSP